MFKNKKLIVLIITALLGAVGFKVSQNTVAEFVDPFVQSETKLETKETTNPTPTDTKTEEQPNTTSAPPATQTKSFEKEELEHQTKQGSFKQEFNKASAISPQRRVHILMGDRTGGGHMFGAGKPCKSEFPSDWDEDKIIDTIDLIAANDNANWEQQRNGYHVREQMIEGVKVRVVKGRKNEQVITAYPLNMGRNPCPANDN